MTCSLQLAKALFDFLPGAHGQLVSVSHPRRTGAARDPKRIDRDERQREA